ncbi:septum site-determining protein Ssd [Streptomyces sp. NPDC101118]|uniref:septum site-determining protein Ssd n=1 Tax=Streptomyces sp. NPDC101118 TaxID=3366109 RepID=UPI0037F24454
MEGPVPGEVRAGGPLIVTEDPDLLDDLLRLCAAAGAEPRVQHSVPEQTRDAAAGGSPPRSGAGPGWESAPLVLVGEDAVGRVRGAPRRGGVLLVGRHRTEDPEVWRAGVEIGAEQVLRLPDREAWLADRIADVAEGTGRQALAVGVIGGCGGAGASTLACALAVGAARAGERTMLVDADPLGGGLDVLLAGEHAEGLRWPDFAASRGRVGAGALEESLPRLHGLRLLSWDRGDQVVVPPAAVRSVLAAARRRGGVVVVDLPRRLDDGVAEVLAQLDLVLLVVPGELRAVAAAGRVAGAVGAVARDLRLVVRGPFAPGLDAEAVARLLALPSAGEVPREAGLGPAAGEPPGVRARGPLGRFCSGFWERALAGGGAG